MFYYTYVLLCADGKLYVGSTNDLRGRLGCHANGEVPTTRSRRPVRLVYYEACLDEASARLREKQLKTGYGRRYLKARISHH